VRNLIGAPILDSVSGLQDIDAYVAHVGTLQHKIGWLTNANGIVHGPTTELTKMESSAYSCERASAPMIIPPAHVVDVSVDSPRGPGYFDYRIVDTSMIVEGIVSILKSRSVYA